MFLVSVQDWHQISAKYGEETKDVIMSSSAVKIVKRQNNPETRNPLLKGIPTLTKIVHSYSADVSRLGSFWGGGKMKKEYLSLSNITVDTYYHKIWCLMYANVYASSSYVTLSYSANWPTAANAKYYALYKRTLTVPTNQLLTLNLQCSIMGAVSDSASSYAGANSFYASSVTWYPGVIINNSDDSYCIASISPTYSPRDSYNNSIAFTSNYSTINVYFLISSTNVGNK